MRAHFGLPSVEAEEDEGRPPIKVKFEIPYFTVSGIQVRFSECGGVSVLIIIVFSFIQGIVSNLALPLIDLSKTD